MMVAMTDSDSGIPTYPTTRMAAERLTREREEIERILYGHIFDTWNVSIPDLAICILERLLWLRAEEGARTDMPLTQERRTE